MKWPQNNLSSTSKVYLAIPCDLNKKLLTHEVVAK
jgi:hypothetical protein